MRDPPNMPDLRKDEATGQMNSLDHGFQPSTCAADQMPGTRG